MIDDYGDYDVNRIELKWTTLLISIIQLWSSTKLFAIRYYVSNSNHVWGISRSETNKTTCNIFNRLRYFLAHVLTEDREGIVLDRFVPIQQVIGLQSQILNNAGLLIY